MMRVQRRCFFWTGFLIGDFNTIGSFCTLMMLMIVSGNIIFVVLLIVNL
jgi:hypothetical protein